jgi:hypothetical protein
MTSNRSPLAQIVMMDGSFASLAEGRGSSLLRGGMGPLPGQVELHYAPGQQWAAWRTLPELVAGASLERNIRRAYGWLARRWQPGVALYFFGYSRGAVGVCALAQMIARVGLLRRQQVSAERLRCAWNIFRYAPEHRLDPQLCHDHVPIRMIGLLDMVMSLGLRLPMVWDLAAPDFDYGRGQLAPNVEYGAHALALDETRSAFQPILWEGGEHPGRVNQVWFRGCHADIGGQLGQHEFARPLANLPLVWLLSRPAAAHRLARPPALRCQCPGAGIMAQLGQGLPDPWSAPSRAGRLAPAAPHRARTLCRPRAPDRRTRVLCRPAPHPPARPAPRWRHGQLGPGLTRPRRIAPACGFFRGQISTGAWGQSAPT